MSDFQPSKRMNRVQFFEKLAPMGVDRVREILWTLYWRGSANVRERVENALEPAAAASKAKNTEAIDFEWLLEDVERFVSLARSGAYMGGTREVHRTERSRWRLTYRRLVDDASKTAVQGWLEHGARALELLIDLACELYRYDYFHSDDPVAAMWLVVSESVQLLWTATLGRDGFPAFVRRAAPQLVRWESRYGWTRRGEHPIVSKEVQLAEVMANLLRGRGLDAWITVVDAHLEALSDIKTVHGPRNGWDADHEPQRRAENLARFHDLLLDRLFATEAEDRLDRIVRHPALSGPEITFLRARLAHRRGDVAGARELVSACLEKLPGHRDFLTFAQKIQAALPPRAKEKARSYGPPAGGLD